MRRRISYLVPNRLERPIRRYKKFPVLPVPRLSHSPSLFLMTKYPSSPREAARRFTPELTALVNEPLYSDVWTDERLSPRDRSIATLAALIVLYRPEELPAHLRRAADNGLTQDEISALITHVAFYGGFPSAISASMLAADVFLGPEEDTEGAP